MRRMLAHNRPRLPADRPRYLMGVRHTEDIVASVAEGIDMFDCVMPTRNAQRLAVLRLADLKIKNAAHREDTRPSTIAATAMVCCNFSRAYSTTFTAPVKFSARC